MLHRNAVLAATVVIAFGAGCTPAMRIHAPQPGAIVASDWPGYNRTLAGDRFSPLSDITRANVAQLHPICTYTLPEVTSLQTGPIVVAGTMYFTTDTISYAIDASSCAEKWKRVRHSATPSALAVHRGFAYLNGRLFRGTSDAHALAMDTADSRVIWDRALDVNGPGVSYPMAPIAADGLVFLGNAGGDQVGAHRLFEGENQAGPDGLDDGRGAALLARDRVIEVLVPDGVDERHGAPAGGGRDGVADQLAADDQDAGGLRAAGELVRRQEHRVLVVARARGGGGWVIMGTLGVRAAPRRLTATAADPKVVLGAVWANAARSHMHASLQALPPKAHRDDFFLGNMIPTCVCDDRAAGAVDDGSLGVKQHEILSYRTQFHRAQGPGAGDGAGSRRGRRPRARWRR